jgi:hypothetical protein
MSVPSGEIELWQETSKSGQQWGGSRDALRAAAAACTRVGGQAQAAGRFLLPRAEKIAYTDFPLDELIIRWVDNNIELPNAY